MGVIKFILVTLLILYVIRIILRLVFPYVLKSLFSKVHQQAENHQRQQQKKPEGSISIDYMPPQPKSGNADKLGDFVDYEEVK
ncbi:MULTISPECIES: hypothetical protein [Pedobacter]|uniref:DUF4834 domain-containing protein n=1 Tax=Pedobacter heparinus (strain ATCC 13125 / DSM 2366 / CIP 104194 / JCM 7457 / NBRC 12017 / NCIMB 9290 / NRRL B-14731 / HIM 762-3) TaxID=485917 RepID=C6XWD6_PEDHD|nr:MULTISPECIES: hypothetical protein [Pedobacter]ACU06225.1 hypothetical protein Phep_4034 [Pedobacter heparinus DSM 2366]MBB5439746.1 hypothetical protein [Pedobacter sp. AK017]